MCWTAGLWMEGGWMGGWSNWGNKGRWAGAERCPTEGGTDEVREMEGKENATRVGGH